MRCIVCSITGPDKFTRAAESWDWFTGYLKECVHFCPQHKNSPERTEMWRVSQIRPSTAKTELTALGSLKALLETDGHEVDCQFSGCTCGRVERYKIARADAVNLVAGLKP